MERESLVRVRCIRVATSVAERGAQGEVALDLPEYQRGFILHEIYARADLAHVEPEDVALEIHDEPSRSNDENAKDETFACSAFVNKRR